MGPEISGTDVALVLLLWAGLHAALTAPGWVVVALVARRRRIARGPGRSWPAALAGALVAVLVSALMVPALAELVDPGSDGRLVVVAGWVTCWLLAALVAPHGDDGSPRRTYATAGREHGR